MRRCRNMFFSPFGLDLINILLCDQRYLLYQDQFVICICLNMIQSILFDQNVTVKWIGGFCLLSIYLRNNFFLYTKKEMILTELVYTLQLVSAVCENTDRIYKKYRFYQCFHKQRNMSQKHRIGPAEPVTILCFDIVVYNTVQAYSSLLQRLVKIYRCCCTSGMIG